MTRLTRVLRRAVRGGAAVAAAVPVRRREDGDVEFLIVRTSNGERWTFPKGGVERGESMSAAAAREAREEAGVTGTVGDEPLGVYRYAPSRNGSDDVTAFLLDVRRDGLAAEPGRQPTWLGREAALERLVQGRENGLGEAMDRILRAAEGAARARGT
jgi:8-oxo-dGTP pyrophosphatase MutT (NUDIX family)